MVNDNTGTSQQIAERKQAILAAVWTKFKTLELYRIDGEGPLTYYKGKWENTGYGNQDTDYLLSAIDAQCGNWANMFIDTLKVQGVSTKYIRLVADNIKKEHNGHVDRAIRFLQKSTEGQGHTNLSLLDDGRGFAWHAIVEYTKTIYDPDTGTNRYEKTIYDPSTGDGPYNDLSDYINNALNIKIQNWRCTTEQY